MAPNTQQLPQHHLLILYVVALSLLFLPLTRSTTQDPDPVPNIPNLNRNDNITSAIIDLNTNATANITGMIENGNETVANSTEEPEQLKGKRCWNDNLKKSELCEDGICAGSFRKKADPFDPIGGSIYTKERFWYDGCSNLTDTDMGRDYQSRCGSGRPSTCVVQKDHNYCCCTPVDGALCNFSYDFDGAQRLLFGSRWDPWQIWIFILITAGSVMFCHL